MANIVTFFSFVFFTILPASVMSAENIVNDETTKEYHLLGQMLSEVRLEKMQAETMVETMVKSGRFSADEGDKARRAIASVHEDDIEQIKEQAIVHVKKHDLANK